MSPIRFLSFIAIAKRNFFRMYCRAFRRAILLFGGNLTGLLARTALETQQKPSNYSERCLSDRPDIRICKRSTRYSWSL